jgi:hypothetical protein
MRVCELIAIEVQLVAPILAATTAGSAPKLLPSNVITVPPLVGPFLRVSWVTVGASYLTEKDATWPPTWTNSVRMAPVPGMTFILKDVDDWYTMLGLEGTALLPINTLCVAEQSGGGVSGGLG